MEAGSLAGFRARLVDLLEDGDRVAPELGVLSGELLVGELVLGVIELGVADLAVLRLLASLEIGHPRILEGRLLLVGLAPQRHGDPRRGEQQEHDHEDDFHLGRAVGDQPAPVVPVVLSSSRASRAP